MKPSEALRTAHDEMAATGWTCGVDAYLKNGSKVGETPNLDDSYVLLDPEARERMDETNAKLLSTPLDAIESMCVQGALWRGAQGNVQVFNESRFFIMRTLEERGLLDKAEQATPRMLWAINDTTIKELPDSEVVMLDVLITASKIADDEGQ